MFVIFVRIASLLESPQAILTTIQNMFYEEIRTKPDLSYISICSLSILCNSKFILMALSLGTNAVVVTRVHCTSSGSLTGLYQLNQF